MTKRRLPSTVARAFHLSFSLVLGFLFMAGPAQGSEFVYRLSPFDKVSISVYGEPDLKTEQLITDEGAIFLPLLGAVNIEGKTVAEASKQIEKAFVDKKYLSKPVVTINIEEFAPKVITVLGEVQEPGTVELARGTSGTTIEMAVAQAGGFKNTAKTNAVVITRANASTPEGKSQVVDVDDIISKSKEGDAPLLLEAGDVIFVPRRVF